MQVLVDPIDARRLSDRSNPPPDSDDSDDDLEYDIYGWFNFETDAEGVQRLDRKWVPLAAAAAAEDFSDALEARRDRGWSLASRTP